MRNIFKDDRRCHISRVYSHCCVVSLTVKGLFLRMKYGFILTGDANDLVELAQEAETAGWDGVFLPDDWMSAWIKLTAIAMRHHSLLLPTTLPPFPHHFP